MENEIKTIRLLFDWASFMPDRRDFKPSSPIFYPKNISIAVDIPIEYFIDNEKINDSDFTPILSVAGMRYVVDQFELVMSDSCVAAEPNQEWEENWKDSDVEETKSEEKLSDKDIEWE